MPILPIHPVLPACLARELSLSTDARDGEFNGMSHAGIYLVLRNIGRRTCRISGLPVVTLHGATGQALAHCRTPVGLHPGAAALPVTLRPGTRVATGLRWVSGPVYAHNRRLDVRYANVAVAQRTLRTPLRAVVYAQEGRPATFDQQLLTYPG